MNDYSQPDFYRFNEDSIKLVKRVISRMKFAENILDLGAGSGIIGIELANHFNPATLTLVEMEKDYFPHLKLNVEHQLKSSCKLSLENNTFGEWKSQARYDLIVSNPPYFLKGHGEISKDLRKYQARTFAVDDWHVLINLILRALSPEGKAFIVCKKDSKISSIIQQYNLITEQEDNLMFIELSGLDKN